MCDGLPAPQNDYERCTSVAVDSHSTGDDSFTMFAKWQLLGWPITAI